MKQQLYLWRKIKDKGMSQLIGLSALMMVGILFLILGYIFIKGVSALNWDFFTQLPKPVGEAGGGMANAIVGSFILLGLACSFSLPLGILAGIYLSEFGRNQLGTTVRFAADLLTGLPSIVVGIFIYTLIVLPMKGFSAIAGGIALGIIMVPVITRTTEEMMKIIPLTIREAALALGIREWRTILSVVLPAALPGIITGIMLAIARAAGETAPLLFTALGNRFWHSGLDQPIAALPLQIFTYAISPYEDWHAQAWAGALVLIILVLGLSIATRFLTRGRYYFMR